MDLQKEKIMYKIPKKPKFAFCKSFLQNERDNYKNWGLFYNLFSNKENFYCFDENLGAKKSIIKFARNKC